MSAFKKSLLVAGVAMILSNNVFADEGHGIVKFKGEVISAPCSIKPGDEDLTVNLGEVADTVLKSDQKSLAEPFTIHLQDCMLSQGGTTYSKAKVTFTTANTGNDSNLLIVFYVQIMPDDFVMQLHRF
ncbi:fimbrial protein [Escherichia coli N40607]|nr:fimbrial protein [Escherichia coli N40607]